MLTKNQTKFPLKALNESINWELMTDLSKTILVIFAHTFNY